MEAAVKTRPGAAKQTIALSLAVGLAAKAIERRSTIPILSNLLLASDGETVTVSGTDLDLEVTAVAAANTPPFQTTVEADLLQRIVTKMFAEDSLRLDGHKLVVGDGPTFTLDTLPPDDYPRLRPIEPTVAFDLPAGQFLADLEAASLAISTDETRYYLTGVCFHTREGKLRFAATDGHRLHMVERDAPNGVELGESIVPSKCIKILRAVLKALPIATVKAEFGKLRARFTIGPVTINTKLIDGTYPDYQRVFPQGAKGTLTAFAAPLQEIVESGTWIGTEHGCYIVFDFNGGIARAKQVGAGAMTAALPGDREGDLPSEIGFNARYLQEVLAGFTGREITLHLIDQTAPALFTSPGSDLTAVLMPVRVS